MFSIWSVLNLTPDSFHEASRVGANDIVASAQRHFDLGCDVLDIGAESSRPGADPVSWQEEWRRLEKPLKNLKAHFGDTILKRLSVDTYKYEIIERCLDLGIAYINDISGGRNVKNFKAAAKFDCKYVIMHSYSDPKTMQSVFEYTDVVSEVKEHLRSQSEIAIRNGIKEENIIWDYGIGFGKSVEHNLALLKNTRKFQNYPLLVGISRKSFLGKLLDLPRADERGHATNALHMYLALQGVEILRVHDTEQAAQIKKLLQALK